MSYIYAGIQAISILTYVPCLQATSIIYIDNQDLIHLANYVSLIIDVHHEVERFIELPFYCISASLYSYSACWHTKVAWFYDMST